MRTRLAIGSILKGKYGGSMTVAIQGAAGQRVIDVREAVDGRLTNTCLCLPASEWASLIQLIQQGIAALNAE